VLKFAIDLKFINFNIMSISGRAARSTDVVIFNASDESFQLMSSTTDSGIFTSSMLPPHEIPAKSSVIYGCESNGVLTGATECR
jgi:hypothetical protein